MEATVTNLGPARHLTALLLISISGFMFSTAQAQVRPSMTQGQPELLYVQAPSWSASQPALNQPVVAPMAVAEGQWDQIGHLWPRLVSYSLETNSVEPYVQPDMRIGMQYNYSFNFELSARNSNGKALPIPDGWYQLQIVVIRKSRETIRTKAAPENPLERYVTSTSMFLRVANGSFGRKVSLRFPDIVATSLKHHLYVELIPLKDECEKSPEQGGGKFPCIQLNKKGEPDPLASVLEPRSDYKTYLVEMPFIPYMSSGGKIRDADDIANEPLPFTDDSLTRFIVRAQMYRGRLQMARTRSVSPAEHAANENITLESSEAPIFAPIKSQLLNLLNARALGNLKVTEDYGSLFASLCTELANRNQDRNQLRYYPGLISLQKRALAVQIKRCQAEPQKFLRLTRILHVGKPIASEVKRILQKPMVYTLMANYMSNRSSSVDTFTGFSIKPPAIIAKFLDQIGIGTGHTVNYANSRSLAESGIASMSTTIDFNYLALDIPTIGSQQCLEVRAIKESFSPFFDSSPGAKNGFYICAPVSTEKINVAEVYAHAFERCRDTTMMDCDTLTQSVNVPMRGDREISEFFYAIRRGVSPDHNNMITPFGDIEGASRYFANIPTNGAMQVITPIEFPREIVPSFIQRLSGNYQERFNDGL